ncbi:MAG: phosphomannomutase/phosphoglucomutase, partial [Clostridia bacterium]|nr:phosphomannomutase/phosphoglucomutase [Clostridia bacterium]
MSFNFFDLKSGTDVRGVAYAPENEITLTDERVDLIVKAFSERFDFSKQITIAVGHDSRLSANRIKNAVAKGLKEVGVRVLDVGLASTPAMFMTTKLG